MASDIVSGGFGARLNRAQAEESTRLRAELAAAQTEMIEWRSAFQRVTPGGSEFTSPKAVRKWADRLKMDVFNANKAAILTKRDLAAANERAEKAELRSAALLSLLPDEMRIGEVQEAGRAYEAALATLTAERDGQQARADLSDGMIQSLVDQKKALIAERDEARKSWKEAADGWVFETNRIDALLPHLTATELALSASQEREKALRVALGPFGRIANDTSVMTNFGSDITHTPDGYLACGLSIAVDDLRRAGALAQEAGEC